MLTGDDGSDKRTNEIGVAIPLLDQLGDLAGKTVTADALLTQTAIASYLRKHDAHYMFVAKDNQKTLLNDIRLWFHDDAKRPPDFAHTTGKPINGKLPTAHGRWEQREIWTTTALNDYLLFPGVGQAFLIRRTRCQVRKGRVTDTSVDTSWGVTSHTPRIADADLSARQPFEDGTTSSIFSMTYPSSRSSTSAIRTETTLQLQDTTLPGLGPHPQAEAAAFHQQRRAFPCIELV